MSEKPTGYRVEYASTARAKCKGPKPCSGIVIAKQQLRFGTLVDFRGNQSFTYRHWGCVTPKIIEKMKSQFNDPSELDGYDELRPEDQERISTAFEEGHVAEEDIPETAKKEGAGEDVSEEEGEDKPKKKTAPKKAAAKKSKDEGAEGEAVEKPKKPRAKKAKVVMVRPPSVDVLVDPSLGRRG
ncbi:hypothetical protein AMATHDRAFT_151459 [Amanita thiersii Skay4041]|uniref:PARP-type domain-containing protein n=1 Tax=Amanita thiersii Skay4041 TaxID=703135 RepID=A0A2A9NJ20_9AGAR|nr:hypothetical protein AMATHDRAFT_151459 [Amanita thiersii Skay4041]